MEMSILKGIAGKNLFPCLFLAKKSQLAGGFGVRYWGGVLLIQEGRDPGEMLGDPAIIRDHLSFQAGTQSPKTWVPKLRPPPLTTKAHAGIFISSQDQSPAPDLRHSQRCFT